MTTRYVVSFLNPKVSRRPKPDRVFRSFSGMVAFLNQQASVYDATLYMRNHATDAPVLRTHSGFEFYSDSAPLEH